MEHCGGGRVNSYFQRLAILVLMACAVIAVLPAPTFAQFPPAPGTGLGVPETIEAIESARITTRILYVTAHPDDESGAVLTYLVRGLHADVALLSLTRGEGGQNDLGPEQAPQLGLIRTQELLAATRGYGVKLYFTRAKDFGYSKTPEETEKIWGNQVLEDMARVIRTFRPNVVINGWGGVHGGHGHHQAAGLLTPKAVQSAADSSFSLPGSASEEKDLIPWGDRKPVLGPDVDRSASPLILAGKKLDEVPKPITSLQVPPPVVSLIRSLARKREKIDAALALVTGVRLEAAADRGEIVSGETFTVRVESRQREGIAGDFKKPALLFTPGWSIPKEEPESPNAIRFTVLAGQNPQHGPEAPANAILPEPPPLLTASQEAVIDGYSFTVSSPVTSVHASSTRVDRMNPLMVPAYTLAIEPKQAIEILAKPKKPFDVLLRVHSYATQPGQVRVGLNVPRGWKTAAPVSLKFGGASEQYARLSVTPPLKLTAGNYKITAYAERAADRSRGTKAEKFTASLEPLPTLPTQLWSEPAQCVVHALAINVPQNLRVGYVTAESEPVPEALQRLGISVDMLNATALAFGDLSRFNAIVVGVRAYELRPELAGANQRLLH